MNLRLLSETPWAIPCLANWYYEEWGHLKKGSSVESITDELQSFLNSDKIPLIVVAVEGNTLLGAAKLRYYEMSIYPEKEHWLGGVYVSQKHRGNSIAEHIIRKITSTALNLVLKISIYRQSIWMAGYTAALAGKL